jgi:hypothetical protein
MGLNEDIAYLRDLLDAFAQDYCRMGVAAEDQDTAGVPPDMQAAPIDAEGWVEWRLLPSTLTEADVSAVEGEFGIRFPPLFRAYLLARFHLFDQVHSRRYDQLIFMTDVPSGRRLRKLRELIRAWQPLIKAGFVPFAEWGDSWGPMCFDVQQRATDGECPVVWMDHERLIPLGAKRCSQREEVMPWVQPLYASCQEFLEDVFVGAERGAAPDPGGS